MKLSELFLNRFLYRDNTQNLETKDSDFISADSTPDEPASIPSGGAAQDINTGNVTINGKQLTPGTYPVTVLDVSNWGWGQTCAFTSTDTDTVSWGSGTFTSASGVSYAISAGNTGNMTAKNYIYLDLLVSETVYQVTTSPATAVGIGKVLVAVAQNSATGNATYNLSEATQIVSDNILANSINASKIVAGSITATQISSSYVYAGTISANNITAGTITGSTLQTASSGQRVVVNGSNNKIEFYNSSSTLVGSLVATTNAAAMYVGSNYYFFNSDNFSPYTTADLGTSISAWRDLYLTGTAVLYDVSATGTVSASYLEGILTSAGATINGTTTARKIVPDGDSIYSLGDSSNHWTTVYGNVWRDASNNYFSLGSGTTFYVNGNTKTAIVPTSKGYNALYCIESPSVWFMDFCEEKNNLDPMFKEVTVAPYHYIKCEDGGYQVWGKRKGHEFSRFESKTEEEFLANERFLNMNKPSFR